MNSPSVIHFRGLNLLRFLSSFAIIVFHSTESVHASLPRPVGLFLHNFPLGVDMFFLISGFLIVHLLLLEKQRRGSISLHKFYARRALRIFPLYYLIVGIAYLQYHTAKPEIDFAKQCYFAGNFWLISTGKWTVTMLNPLWSLCIEEHFYLIIPLLLLLVPLEKTRILFWAVILNSVLFRAYAALASPQNWMLLYCHTLSRCDLLAVGGLLAVYHTRFQARFSIGGWMLATTTACLALLMSTVDAFDFSTPEMTVFGKYLFALPMVVLFAGVVLNTREGKFLARLKASRRLDYLGKISYGLYMLHTPMSNLLYGFPPTDNNIWLRLLLTTLLAIATAATSYEFFERRFLNLKSKFETIGTTSTLSSSEDRQGTEGPKRSE